jgi:hypothetical protein
MRNLLFLLCLAYLPVTSIAQLSEILKDPNISWAATYETEIDFRLSSPRENSNIQLTKFIQTAPSCSNFNNDNWLATWILDEMKAGKYQIYDDPSLSIIVSHSTLMNKISTIDTVITFDPNSYEERVQVIRNDIGQNDIVGFRTHQVIYYDKKQGGFNTQLLALAPMIKQTDPTGKIIGEMPLAWLAMGGQASKNLSPDSPDVTWAALIMDKKGGFPVNKLKVQKDEQKKTFVESLFQEAFSMKHPVRESVDYGCGNLLTKKELESMGSAVDTVITFDPVTYKETMQIVRNNLSPADVKTASLVQEWYYDNRRKMLANRLKAIGPIVDQSDVNGNFLYSKILYYLYF